MSIIGDIRDEREDKMFVKLMELISNNIDIDSEFLYANPQPYFRMDLNSIIEECADIFGVRHESAGKIFNEIMDKKEQNGTSKNNC